MGNHIEANEELEKITPKFRAHPNVLETRWEIYAKTKNWTACVDIGKALIELAPDRAASFIHCAFALHELKRTSEAFDILSPVAAKFPTNWTIPYNLACYSCQLSDLVGARGWLAQAFRLGNAKEIKLQALDDPDLAPLWTGEN